MDEINRRARASVARFCAYALAGISRAMMGFGANPRLAFQLGGILSLAVAVMLILKASGIHADGRDDNGLHLQAEPFIAADHYLRQMVSLALREAYFSFARRAAAVSGGLFVVSLAIGYVMA